MSKTLSELFREKTGAKPCKGRIFRYKENQFKNQRGQIVTKQTFTPMKKLSCKGCGYCEDLMEILVESDYHVDIDKEPQEDRLYELYVSGGCNYYDDYGNINDSGIDLKWKEYVPPEEDNEKSD